MESGAQGPGRSPRLGMETSIQGLGFRVIYKDLIILMEKKMETTTGSKV